MSHNLKHRLSAHDAVFLYWERPEQPFHVCECMVYDGKFNAEDIKRLLAERMHLLPRYRQKVVFAPLQVAHPTWEDDPAFDLSNHVVEADLPAPHDDEALSIYCGKLFGELIDRNHPLWHLTVIHGHNSGNTIVFLKLHHAMVDGVSSVELIEVLHSTERGAKPPPPAHGHWKARPVPGKARRLLDAVADQTDTVLGLYRDAANLLRAPSIASIAKRFSTLMRTAVDTGEMALLPLPKTPFNKPISPARQFTWLELPLEEVHRVRKQHGATVNDLVLAILSGGLGRYMRREGHETEGVALRAMCPVSVRAKDQSGAMGNQISMVAAPLHVGITDPLQRLNAEMESMRELKEKDQAGGMFEMISAAKYYPAWMWKEIWARWPMKYFPFNIVSTNVPGPKVPLYLDRHELLHWYPFGVNWTTSGLFLCTLSYREYLVLGLVADPTIVKDVWEVNEDLRASYEEIKAATLGEPAAPTKRPKPSAPVATQKRARSPRAVPAALAEAVPVRAKKPKAVAAKRGSSTAEATRRVASRVK
jgi:diacylglycerol O-acyltransferase